MIVIVGESASGKSSVARYLMNNYGHEKIVTYTTRAPRENEVDGLDYHFISQEDFATLVRQNFFAEIAEYNGWWYGSARKDYKDNAVIVLTPRGLRALKENGVKNIYSVYIKVPRRDRLIKCLERGDDIEEAYRRSLSDVGQFDGIDGEVDLIIENPRYLYSIQSIAKEIIKETKR